MRLLILTLLLAAPAAARDAPPVKPLCQDSATTLVQGTRSPGVHPLSEEPPAQAYRAVLRTVDSCTKPMPVSERLYDDAGSPKRR